MSPTLLIPALMLVSAALPGLVVDIPDTLLASSHTEEGSDRLPVPLTFHEGVGKPIAMDDWIPQPGDRLSIDVEANVGILIHASGERLSFPVITGQRRTLHYLGRRYFGATPQKSWAVKRLDTQRDRITYGRTGRFLRLYDHGTRTHYGLHGHRDEAVMFEKSDRFQSMGCVIVQENIMNLLVKTFEVSGGEVAVVTHGEESSPLDTMNVVVSGGGEELD